MSFIALESAHILDDSISKFQDLSRRASKALRKSKVKIFEKPFMSPREEIYKSMLREIKNVDSAQMHSLVHKASGILRLSHYKDANKDRKLNVSWDIDGRRVFTYEDGSGKEQVMLQRKGSSKRRSRKSLLASLNEPIFGMDSNNLKFLSEYVDVRHKDRPHSAKEVEYPTRTVSKVWEDYIESGDPSKLWQSKEGILTDSRTPSAVTRRLSSATSKSDNKSVISTNSETPRPPWKAVFNPPRTPSSHYLPSRESLHSVSSLPSVASSKRTIVKSSSTPQSRTQSSYSVSENEKDTNSRIHHICVVNGLVVSFKNFGFENFTNWFGDESMLEANQQRSQPKIHKELDLTSVKRRDIKIRLLDGCKLEVESTRRVRGTPKPIRKKEFVIIPEGFRAEDLLMCRTKTGKLVVEDVTSEPTSNRQDQSKPKSPKSKAKWKLSLK